MKKLFLGLGFLIITLIGSLILSNNKNLVNADNDGWVNVGGCISNGICDSNAGTQNQTKTTPGYTTPRVCGKTCEGVTEPFSASRTLYANDYVEYSAWGTDHNGNCGSNDNEPTLCEDWTVSGGNHKHHYRTIINAHACPADYTYQEQSGSNDCYKVETFSATITYGEKSNDPNHCHKETPVTPSIPSWASNEFNQLPQLKDKVDSNVCTGGVWVPEIVENRIVSCLISEDEVTKCEEVDPCEENPQAEGCVSPTPTESPTPTPTPTEEPTPTATPSATVTPTSTPEKPGVEHTGLSVQKLSCTEYDFKAEMEVKNSDHPLQDILVSFTYRGEKKDAYTNKDGYASVTFTFSGESLVKATPINGYESREAMATQETNCQEFGAMSKAVVSDSRVLGANTYAKTGVFEDIMMSIMGLSGATMTAVGAKLNAKKRK